jgi:hypothetical protein
MDKIFKCDTCKHTFADFVEDSDLIDNIALIRSFNEEYHPEDPEDLVDRDVIASYDVEIFLDWARERCPACGGDDICGNQEDVEEGQEAVYVCAWGYGFPSTYKHQLQVETASFFRYGLGYDADDIRKIMALREGQSFAHDHGGHWIMRVCDGFKPEP